MRRRVIHHEGNGSAGAPGSGQGAYKYKGNEYVPHGAHAACRSACHFSEGMRTQTVGKKERQPEQKRCGKRYSRSHADNERCGKERQDDAFHRSPLELSCLRAVFQAEA